MSDLDELARSLAVRGSEITRIELGGRWGKHRRRQPGRGRLYAVLRGGGELAVGRERLSLGPGELAFLPRADEHVLRDGPTTHVPRDGSACVGMRQVAAQLWASEAEPDARLVIVDLELDAADAPWLSLLAPVVHVGPEGRELGRWLADTLALLAGAHELSPTLRDAITTSWAHALYAHALRSHAAALPARADALRDAPILAALTRLRAEPERRWELGELASQVGLSRSVLAARTTALLGEPVGSYLRRLRLSRAADLLATTDAPIKVVASRVGYASEPAFTRAFARALGSPPNAYRRARRQA